jgi:hypothetical protein
MTPQSSLASRQATLLAGRVLCVFFLFYAILNLTELPSYMMGVLHYHAQGDGLSTGTYYSYWTSKYIGWIGGSLLKATVEIWIAGIFYRCGPRVSRFFLGDQVPASEASEAGVAD